MSYIYIGKFFPKGQLHILLGSGKANLGLSNHNFEMSIINGLCQHNGIDLQCLTLPGVYSYPHNNTHIFTKAESYDYKNTHVYSIGFCNLILIKELWSTISLSIRLLQLVLKIKENRIDVIINTPDNRLLTAVKIAKFFTGKRLTQTIVIPDIPSMVTAMDKHNAFKSALLKYRNRRAMKMASSSDGLVLLTEAMMDFVKKPIKHIVMEGIVDVKTMDIELGNPRACKKIILYTGTLRKLFGVLNLVQAFKLVADEEAELWICGSGDSRGAIETAANADSRIKFFGLVDSHTALKMQRQATILVNPRTSDGEYTKYSFPSKTMEYLLSGKSTIINRLPGIPEEYYHYVFTPKDESIEALAECISNVLAMDIETRDKIAKSGREFIISHKNSKKQTERILEMINQY